MCNVWCVKRLRRASGVGVLVGILACGGAVRADDGQTAPPTLLAQARDAEAAYQFDVALDRLYALEIEQPGTPDALTGRLHLARLLTLANDLPAAILQCQALRDELPPNQREREQAFDLATLLARRLRSRVGTFTYGAEVVAPRGLTSLDEPTALVNAPDGTLLLVDQGADKLYRLTGDAAAPLGAAVQNPSAAIQLSDGAVAIGTKNGIVSLPAGKTVPTTGSWGGKTRALKRVRSMAANSKGDLFLVDREYDGLLRCAAGAATCAPWSAPGALRAVKVGPSDYVYTLDEKQQVIRVFDDAGKLVTTVGPLFGGTKLEKVADIAVDSAYGLYLLDADLHRVEIVALHVQPDGRLSADSIGSVAIPPQGDRAIKNPSALTVTPSGAILVAGKSVARMLRFR